MRGYDVPLGTDDMEIVGGAAQELVSPCADLFTQAFELVDYVLHHDLRNKDGCQNETFCHR